MFPVIFKIFFFFKNQNYNFVKNLKKRAMKFLTKNHFDNSTTMVKGNFIVQCC